MTMKKMLSLLVTLVLLQTFPGCSVLGEAAKELDDKNDGGRIYRTEAAVEGKVVPFIVDYSEDESRREREFTLYFVEGGDVPYVELSEYMPLLSEVIQYGVEGADINGLYTINAEGGDIEFPEHYYTVSRTFPFTAMVIDTEGDTIAFSNFNKFTQTPGIDALVASLELPDPYSEPYLDYITPFREAGLTEEELAVKEQEYWDAMNANRTGDKELFKLATRSFNIAGNPILLNMRDYEIDLVEKDGKCFVPLQTMTDLFMCPIGALFIWNNEKLYAFAAGSDIIEEVNAREKEPMSEEFALFNYNELRLLLDVHYGLKEDHGIIDFDEYLRKTGLRNDLTGTSSEKFDKAVSRLTNTYMDDGHSGFVSHSWRSTYNEYEIFESITQMGPSSQVLYRIGSDYYEAREAAFPNGIPMYEEVGDTAFITFDAFVFAADDTAEYYDPNLLSDVSEFVIPVASYSDDSEDTAVEGEGSAEAGAEPAEEPAVEATEEPAEEPAEEPKEEPAGDSEEENASQPVDTIKLFLYAYQQITRENSPIKNVVIDLSNNSGGQAYAAVFVAASILGRADIALRDTFTGAQTVMTYRADMNLDDQFSNQLDSFRALGVKVYCMVSPNSFSCGNIIPAVCKANYVTVIGQTSGGGACVVLPCCSASGAVFQISGTKQISVIRNGSFYNVDRGIEPDIYISRPEDYYNRPALVERLHSGW